MSSYFEMLREVARALFRVLTLIFEQKLERVVAFITVATVAYSVAAFGFELGFFWELGLDALPVFSPGEHALNAAVFATLVLAVAAWALLVGGAGGAAIASGITAVVSRFQSPAPPDTQRVSALQIAALFNRVFYGLLVLDTVAGIWMNGPHPINLFFVVLFTGVLLADFRPGARLVSPKAAALFLASALLLPVAAGDAVFAARYGNEFCNSGSVKVGNRTFQVRRLLIGSSHAIYRTKAGVYLVDQEGKTAIELIRGDIGDLDIVAFPPHVSETLRTWFLPKRCAQR